MELDIWLPEEKLAFEYQGEQHYHSLEKAFGDLASLSPYTERDEKKLQRCSTVGISLIIIPYWWDGSMPSLLEILRLAEMDVRS